MIEANVKKTIEEELSIAGKALKYLGMREKDRGPTF